MEPISIAFYAIVCGLLSVFAPNLPSMPVRLAVGAVVGVIAALVLPVLRGMMAY